ncbi:transglycosylase domain-containing protein [Candidatus Actinomarina sp.]|nr:transglycosylase domain-containing protein [Candidatus Actinomarina sp.]MDA8709951.1 transglycosylase domain-containing protein [Candidatus Actinomarina sp.]MDA9845818.1 transglycosylase domain-containing protein [Acidimicrobiia bacterium]MDB2532552.1 transglycosylase domain-containing protein [Candidatus Actinomarina sp.]
MAQIHNLENKSRYGIKYIAGFGLLVSALLLSGWFAFFTFLPIKSAMEVVTNLEEKFLPRAEGMVLDFVSLSEPSIIVTSDNQILDELHDGLNRDPIKLSDVPPFVINTLLAAEDSNYYQHEGVDFVAILSAVVDNLRGVTRGGSTITSQVAKQSFVGDEISIRRKVAEAVVAAELERRYSKDQILEYYINSIYWGSGAYGLQSASSEYFNKDVADITLDEAATLVVIIRSPAYYNPRKYPERVLDRRNDVLDVMLKEGFIVDIQHRSAKLAPLTIAEPNTLSNKAEHVSAEVKRRLLNEPKFAVLGSTKEERKKALFGCPSDDTSCTGGGGLTINITVNLELQNHANEVLNKWVPSEIIDSEADVTLEEPESKPTGVITLINNKTGAIEVMASGLPFEEEQYNLATQGKRNPGSAFKPITLLAALESGAKLYSTRDSRSPVEIDCGYPCAPDGIGTKWVVRNYGTSITADRFINKLPAQDRAIELQCVGFHAEELKNKDFIDQFPISSEIDELEEEVDKLLAIGIALGQYSEDGGIVIYTENENVTTEDDEGRTLLVVRDPVLIEEQDNLIQINLESETQFIFKPCSDKSEYNRSIKLLDTSGMVSLEEATRKSVNTVFAQLASELGGEKLSSTANRIGIDSELDPVISLTLGAGAVTPIELASAYSSFANNGYLAPTYLIDKIIDSNGQILYQHISSQRVTIPDPGAAAAVRKTLEVAAQFGTGTRAVLDDRPIAGKTGTHQGFREAWFIGFIPQYTSSVWIGFAEEQLPLTNVEINGEVVSSVSGGRVPAPIWKEFMEKVVEDLPIEEWPADPSDIDKYYEIPTIEIPQLLGLNIIDAEEIAFSGYILPTIKLIDSEEAPGLVLTQSIESGEEMPEGTEVVLEVSGTKFTAAIPNIPPCAYTKDEAEFLIKDFMRETSVILFLKNSFEESEIPDCQGKVIGTNVAQGGTVSTGDSLILIVANSQDDS